MAKRETAAEASRPKAPGKKAPRGKVTEKFTEAGKRNLAKGREDAKKKAAAAKASGIPLGKDRWSMLLDGRLTVRDLDDEEVRRMRVMDASGGFAGRARTLPSHIAQQFQQEAIRRATELFRSFAPRAVELLMEIAEDPDVKPEAQIRALQIALDRGLGKTPETIRLEGVSKFDKVTMDALGLDRDMADDA